MAKSGGEKQTLGNRVKKLEEQLAQALKLVDRQAERINQVSSDCHIEDNRLAARIRTLEEEIK